MNTFTGGTTIEGGTLNINDDVALGAVTGGVTIMGGAKLQATGEITSSRAFTLGAAGGIIDTNGNDLTLDANGTVTGTSLTKIGNGTLTLAGIQSYTTLNANGGITHVDSVLGTGSATVNASAELDFSVSQTLAALTIGDGGVVILGSGSGAAAARERGAVAAAVPEPGSLNLLMLGVLGILGRRRSRRG